MKRIKAFTVITILVLLAVSFTGCGKTVFGVTDNTEKQITITAQNADKDAYLMVGTLEVADGEQIVITSGLEKGSVRVEIVAAPEDQSIDVFPDMEGAAIITADVSGADAASGTVPAGFYLVRATCLEKAAGTVLIEVKPAR